MYQSSIEALTSPHPWATPRAFEFLENFCSNPPPWAKKLFKCPHPHENYQITVLTFL